jgi:hypothetical protein
MNCPKEKRVLASADQGTAETELNIELNDHLIFATRESSESENNLQQSYQ